jgi:Holliday junction resolvase RusA-like endonuclease
MTPRKLTGWCDYYNLSMHRVIKLDWIPSNHKRGDRLAHGRFYVPTRIKREIEAIKAIGTFGPDYAERCKIWEEELDVKIEIFRRTPLEKKEGRRNVARGDPINVPQLPFDALQGVWWKDDEQITKIEIEEWRCQKFNAFVLSARPRGIASAWEPASLLRPEPCDRTARSSPGP